MITIAGFFVRIVGDWMEAEDIVGEQLMTKLGHLSGRDRVGVNDWGQLLVEAQALRPEAPVGLQIGAQVKVRHAGVLGYLVLNCDTLGEALETYLLCERHFYLENLGCLVEDEESWRIEWPRSNADETVLPAVVALSALISFMRQRFSGRCLPREVTFTSSAAGSPSDYQEFFGCPVAFDRQNVSVTFDRAQLELPATGSAGGEFGELRKQQDRAFGSVVESTDPFFRALQQVTLRHLPNGNISLAKVASELCCSVRTLQRILARHHLTYQGLLNGVREQLALSYLRQSFLSLAEIAMLLGYSEQSAFNRAFKHWTGDTPGSARRNIGDTTN